jgi:hypothetical protein
MADLTVPKRRVDVAVTLVGGLQRDVALFLSEGVPGHAGAEKLSDLLNGQSDFLPAVETSSGSMTFLNRTSVMIAEAQSDAERPGSEEHTIPTEHLVELALTDGRVLRGHVDYVLPPESARLVDFLNTPTLFLPLHVGSNVFLVNKHHITRVVLTDAPDT